MAVDDGEASVDVVGATDGEGAGAASPSPSSSPSEPSTVSAVEAQDGAGDSGDEEDVEEDADVDMVCAGEESPANPDAQAMPMPNEALANY